MWRLKLIFLLFLIEYPMQTLHRPLPICCSMKWKQSALFHMRVTIAACLCYAMWIYWGATQLNQSRRGKCEKKQRKREQPSCSEVSRYREISTSITSSRSCPSCSRKLSVHGAGVTAGAIGGGQNQSGRRGYRLQRRDGLQDHGRRRARHVQHNDGGEHARRGHHSPEGTAYQTWIRRTPNTASAFRAMRPWHGAFPGDIFQPLARTCGIEYRLEYWRTIPYTIHCRVFPIFTMKRF